MTQLEALHQLIHLLTKGEKLLFRKFTAGLSSGKGSQTLDLFAALAHSKTFDSGAILKRLPSSAHRRNLPTLQQRLRSLLLRSQFSAAQPSSILQQLQTDLLAIEFLLRKRLHDQARQHIRKATLRARRFDQKNTQLVLLGFERKIIHTLQPSQLQSELDRVFQRENELQAALQQELHLRRLEDRALILLHTVDAPRCDVERELVALGADPHLQPEHFPTHHGNQILAHSVLGLIQMGLRRHPVARQTYAQLMDFWHTDPAWIEEFAEAYLIHFHRYQTAVMYDQGGLEELEQHARALRNMPTHRRDLQFRYRYKTFQQQLVLYMNLLKWEEGAQLIEEATAWLQTENRHLTRTKRLVLLYNFMVFEFLREDFRAANRHLQEILNLDGRHERKDIRATARLFQLLLAYERGHFDLNEFLLRAAQAWFQRNQQTNALSEAVFRFIRESLRKPGGQLAGDLAQLTAELSDMPPVLGHFEIQFWAESRGQGISLPEICARRIAQIQGE